MFDFKVQQAGLATVGYLEVGDVEYVTSFYDSDTAEGHISRFAGIVSVDGEDVRYSRGQLVTTPSLYYGISLNIKDGDPEW